MPRAPRAFLAALCAAALLAFAFYMFQSALQYHAGRVFGDPATTFDQILSDNAEGLWFEHPRRTGNHYFTNHVMLWMIPATLPYYVYDGLFTYIVMINLGLALAVVPLGVLARRITGSEPVAWGLVVLWVLNNFSTSLLFSLHCENLGFPLWFVLYWAVLTRRTGVAWAMVAGLLCIKQDYAVWLCVFGAWLLVFRHAQWRLALGFIAAGIGAFLAFKAIMASLPQPTEGEVGYYWVVERYAGIASTPKELVLYFLTRPGELALRLARPAWMMLILAGGVFCVLGWRSMLLLVPPTFLFFTSANNTFNDLLFYYSYPFLPPLFLAACEGSAWLLNRAGERRVALGRLLAGVAFACALAQAPMVSRTNRERLMSQRVTDRARAARLFVQRAVPRSDRNARAMAQWGLQAFVPRGSQRVAMLPEKLFEADRVLFDTQDVAWDLDPEQAGALWSELRRPGGEWELAESFEGFMLFKRVRPPEHVPAGGARLLPGKAP